MINCGKYQKNLLKISTKKLLQSIHYTIKEAIQTSSYKQFGIFGTAQQD